MRWAAWPHLRALATCRHASADGARVAHRDGPVSCGQAKIAAAAPGAALIHFVRRPAG